MGMRGCLLGFLGSLCLYESLLGTNGNGRKWEFVCYCIGRGLFQGRGGVWIGETLMGGLGFVGCGWAGIVGECVDGWLLVCLARLAWRVVVVGGFEAPRLGGECVYFLGYWMTTNLKLKRPEEMHFAFGTLVWTMSIGYDADSYPSQRYTTYAKAILGFSNDETYSFVL
jgi:hypothetical protein